MWDGIQTAATVAEMVGFDIGGLISRIGQAARTAKQNTKDCEHLARRVSLLADLVPHLHDPEARRAVAGLDGTLREAHGLVVSCQKRGFASQLFSASGMSERFKDVDRKIDAYLSVVPVIGYIGIARRLDHGGGGNGGGTINHHTTSRSQFQLLEDHQSGGGAEDLRELALADIVVATGNFAVVLSADADTGTKVYKGRLDNGTEVAVKRLNARRRGAEDAFFAEQQILSPLRHHHIVRLLGTCADDGERIIVTQFMTNGSLHDHLHGCRPQLSSSSSPVTASWKTRIQVLLGAARAVEHLHCHAMPLVIHGNVASSNILLDAAWSPRLSGFSSSVWRAAGVDSQHVEVTAGSGGGGYADPELCSTGRIRPASDVYGLGVVMLEVLTGQPAAVSVWDDVKQSVVTMTLASFALPSIDQVARLREVLDTRPAPAPTTWQQIQPLQMVANTAAQCLCLRGDHRPAIAEVVANLQQALQLM